MKIRPIFLLLCLILTVALVISRRPAAEDRGISEPAPPTERLVSVEVDASFVPTSMPGSIPVYRIETGPKDGSLSLSCPRVLGALAAERPGPQRYHLDYWEVEWHSRDPDGKPSTNTDRQLAKMTDGGSVLFDGSICPLHHLPMTRESVPVSYGLSDSGSMAERERSFPFGRNSIQGGNSPNLTVSESRAWVCPECLKVEAAWSQRTADSR